MYTQTCWNRSIFNKAQVSFLRIVYNPLNPPKAIASQASSYTVASALELHLLLSILRNRSAIWAAFVPEPLTGLEELFYYVESRWNLTSCVSTSVRYPSVASEHINQCPFLKLIPTQSN
jgi:hypothetical protein